MRILHTADLHFSVKPELLQEVINVTEYILAIAEEQKPDLSVIAGDSLDEFVSAIRIDSEAARAAINFIVSMAEMCPVLIIRGTRSHDRDSVYIFHHLKSKHPIYVGSVFEQIVFLNNTPPSFAPIDEVAFISNIGATLTLLPSPDKSGVISTMGTDSKVATNLVAKESLFDVLSYFGQVNKDCKEVAPLIAIGHGMITGAEFSSGTIATGEDFEFSLNDLKQLNCDLVCFGHIHKQQSFPGNIYYSGSPGRLNFGEKEEKGFLIHDIDEARKVTTRFFPTPARYFVFAKSCWKETGLDGLLLAKSDAIAECKLHPGCDARFQYSIPEEERHAVPCRANMEAEFLAAGARSAKIEIEIIPMFRQRAAGISKKDGLTEKLLMWGETAQVEITSRMLEITKKIESFEVDDLIALAKTETGL